MSFRKKVIRLNEIVKIGREKVIVVLEGLIFVPV